MSLNCGVVNCGVLNCGVTVGGSGPCRCDPCLSERCRIPLLVECAVLMLFVVSVCQGVESFDHSKNLNILVTGSADHLSLIHI